MKTSRFVLTIIYNAILPIVFSALFLGNALAATAQKAATRNLLTGKYSRDFLLTHLGSPATWKPFPPAQDRAAWEALEKSPLNQKRKAYVIARAVELIGKPWPALPATLYMEFIRTGNRSNYEAPYFQRRKNLSTLVIAECMENKGRFLDEIANGIWAICEESTWCLPAHATRFKGDVLHRPDVESLDLFACETGMSLAQIHYLLRKELAALSPALCTRIRREVYRRIIDPYSEGDNFGCSGWINGYNNWSPWCASNVMGAAMYLENNPEHLAGMVYRLMQVVDRFINRYGADGGCDEGPSYWNEAPGAMLVFLELLYLRTSGAIDIYDNPKIAAMGQFIVHAHLAGNWFANFADADPHANPQPGKVYRFGVRIKSEAMKALALLSMRNWKINGPVDPPLQISGVCRSVLEPLMELFWIPPEATPVQLVQETHVWLPDLQVLFARESGTSQKGMIFAAKGGYNAESHNHNDAGHFILFMDGQPGIIDIGRGTYTRQTFSSRRYELWFTRALSHNAPIVNGIEEHPGRIYKATKIHFKQQGSDLFLSMQLDKAYPAEAHLKYLQRTFTFHRGNDPRIVVSDRYKTSVDSPSFVVHMFTPQEIKQVKPGQLSIIFSTRPLLLSYDPVKLKATCKEVPIKDNLIRKSWGKQLNRIDFQLVIPGSEGDYSFTFQPGKK